MVPKATPQEELEMQLSDEEAKAENVKKKPNFGLVNKSQLRWDATPLGKAKAAKTGGKLAKIRSRKASPDQVNPSQNSKMSLKQRSVGKRGSSPRIASSGKLMKRNSNQSTPKQIASRKGSSTKTSH